MGIYVIGNDSYPNVKVGYTSLRDADARRRSLSTGAGGMKLRTLAWMPSGTMEHERKIHELLKQAGAHVDLEWFEREHKAVSIVLTHAREGDSAPMKIIRYLQSHVTETGVKSDTWQHKYDAHGVTIVIGNAKKLCTGCGQWLPITESSWGALWRWMGDCEIRDQPRCVSCRTAPEYFRDDKTIDMWGAR